MTRSLKSTTLAVPALAALLLLNGCGKDQPAAKAASSGAGTVAVLGASDVSGVERIDLVTGVQVSGTLAPANTVQFGAPIADVIEEMLVKEGQRVRKGEVLARFRTTAVRPVAVGAESRWKAARADHARMVNLLREGAVADRDVEAAEAVMREAEAQYASAQKMLEESTLRAPFDGTVSERFAQTGDRFGLGDPVLRVVDTHQLEFEATVTTSDVAQVHIGAPVVLDVTGYSKASIEGRVARINAAADPATRQVKLYVTVPNGDGRLVSGLFASGQVVLQRQRQAIAIPVSGLRTEGATSFVWVIAGGKAAQCTVTTGLRDEVRDRVQILSGLQVGQQVVTGPVSGLKSGQPVQVSRREG